MADLPPVDHSSSCNWEIYDESRPPDEGLVWLASDQEAPTLAEAAEALENAPVDARRSEANYSDGPAEDSYAIPVSVLPSSNSDIRLLQPVNSDSDGSAGILFGSLLPSHKPFGQFNVTRRIFRVAALVSVLLIGSVLPSILGHLRPTRVKASAAVTGPSVATQSVGRALSKPARVLTVMAGRQETVKDIAIRYAGHFDDDLFEEIRSLNPDLKDPDHLEDGQLIRIPLRAATAVR